MQQHAVRFPDPTFKKIREAAKKRGFTSSSEFIRHAVNQELSGGDRDDQRIATTLGQIRTELARLHTVQQTLFAFVDALVKTVLSGLPEQSLSSAKGRERYDRFIRSAAAGLVNGPHPLLREEEAES